MKSLPVFSDVISPAFIIMHVLGQLLLAGALIAAVILLTIFILRKRKK